VAQKKPARIPPPYAPNAVPAIVIGTVGWLIALIVMFAVGNDTWWRWVCVTGFGLGVLGIPVMARYQRVHG
jgi:ABC-type phosphate transport system permease subunit